MLCQILIINEKNVTSIKNCLYHYSVSHIYTKLTETNGMTNDAQF